MSPWTTRLFTSTFKTKQKKRLCLESMFIHLIQNLYSDQILLSNSSNSSPKCLYFIFLYFLKSSNLILTPTPAPYAIAVFDLIRKFVSKAYYSICKKKRFSWLVDLVSEIYLDRKFSVRGEIFKKCLP